MRSSPISHCTKVLRRLSEYKVLVRGHAPCVNLRNAKLISVIPFASQFCLFWLKWFTKYQHGHANATQANKSEWILSRNQCQSTSDAKSKTIIRSLKICIIFFLLFAECTSHNSTLYRFFGLFFAHSLSFELDFCCCCCFVHCWFAFWIIIFFLTPATICIIVYERQLPSLLAAWC